MGQIRIQRSYILWCSVSHSSSAREGAGVPGGCSSSAKGSVKTWRWAAPLGESSSPGKKGHEMERAGEVNGRARKSRGADRGDDDD